MQTINLQIRVSESTSVDDILSTLQEAKVKALGFEINRLMENFKQNGISEADFLFALSSIVASAEVAKLIEKAAEATYSVPANRAKLELEFEG